MIRAHFAHWPTRIPTTLSVPETTLYDNLEITARRYPDISLLWIVLNE